MTIDEAIAACGTEHVPYSIKFYAPRCVVCKEFSPCPHALRAALEYALRDAEAWRRVAVASIDEVIAHYGAGVAGDLDLYDLCAMAADGLDYADRARTIAAQSHRLVLAQMEEEQRRG